AGRHGADMAIQRRMERGKAVSRPAGFGTISAMEAIGLTRDLPIAGAQEKAENAGLGNTPSPFPGFLFTLMQMTLQLVLCTVFLLGFPSGLVIWWLSVDASARTTTS